MRRARRGWRGGAGRCGLRGTLTAPPRPALVSLGRPAGAGRDEAGVAAGCGRGSSTEEPLLPGLPRGDDARSPGAASPRALPASGPRRPGFPTRARVFARYLPCPHRFCADAVALRKSSPQGGRDGWWPEVPCPC